jgi:hypothetical protein
MPVRRPRQATQAGRRNCILGGPPRQSRNRRTPHRQGHAVTLSARVRGKSGIMLVVEQSSKVRVVSQHAVIALEDSQIV